MSSAPCFGKETGLQMQMRAWWIAIASMPQRDKILLFGRIRRLTTDLIPRSWNHCLTAS
jgi:hypothetical protein